MSSLVHTELVGRILMALLVGMMSPVCSIYHPLTGVVPGSPQADDDTPLLLAASLFAFTGDTEFLPVSGASLWLRGDRLQTDSRGTAIWYDASGNNHFLAGNGISRVENTIAGRPAALCNGTSMVLRSITGSDFFSANEGTIYLVMRQAGGKVDNTVYQYYSSVGNDFFRGRFSVADTLSFDFGENGATGTIGVAQPAGWDNSFHILELYRSGANGEILSDGAILTAAAFASTMNTGDSGLFQVCGGHVAAERFLGEIAELILFPIALSAADRSALRCHLSNKYILAATGC